MLLSQLLLMQPKFEREDSHVENRMIISVKHG